MTHKKAHLLLDMALYILQILNHFFCLRSYESAIANLLGCEDRVTRSFLFQLVRELNFVSFLCMNILKDGHSSLSAEIV